MDTQFLCDFIDNLLANNGLKLKRAIGVGLFLFNKLRNKAPNYILDNLKELDKLSLEKKKAILKEVKKFLEEQKKNLQTKSILPREERKPIDLFFKSIDSVKILSKTEKKTLKALGIETVYDALFYFPEKYEDKRLNNWIKTAKVGEKVALKVRIQEVRKLDDGKYSFEVICSDGTGTLSLKYRYKNTSFAYKAFKRGLEIVVYGKLKSYKGEK